MNLPGRSSSLGQTSSDTADEIAFNVQHMNTLSLSGKPNDLKIDNVESIETFLPRYTFEPMRERDHIRTLELSATKHRIECTVHQIKVSSGGYQALSYVWGSEDRPFRAVVLDEHGNAVGYIPLTTNLQRTLCDLRDASDLESKVFWIDQICIDQQGSEKNLQVSMMGDIYRNATKVITCIDPVGDQEEETTGIDLLDRLYSHFSQDYSIILESRGLWRAWLRRSEFPVLDLPLDLQEAVGDDGYVKQGWRWLCSVAFGTWKQRLWMVQEQLLNKNTVMLRGQRLLSWDAVAVMPLLFDLQLLPQRHLDRF